EMLQSYKDLEFSILQREGVCPLRLFLRLLDEGEDNREENFTTFFHKELEERPDITNGTRKDHRQTWRHLNRFRKHIHFEDLNYRLITGFDRYLFKQGLKINTVAGHHKNVETYINRAAKFGFFDKGKNPYIQFAPQKEKTSRPYLTAAELAALEQLIIPETEEKRLLEMSRQMFLLSCYTGLRIGDLLSLAQEHIIETPAGLQIFKVLEKGKKRNKKPHTLQLRYLFPLAGQERSRPEVIIVQALADYTPKENTAPIFRISEQYFRRNIKKLAKLAGIKKDIYPHVARHTFATYLEERGLPKELIKDLMAHSSTAITDVYLHSHNKALGEHLQKLEWS
ncbi:MAG: site-specific integrase, partial [Sinomicrobium sp.]|nr:site-specific integrase [Sinomicrobium sp.]